MATVLLVGTLDTKGAEYDWLRDELASAGCEVLTIDAGTFSDAAADVTAAAVAEAAGAELAALREAGDRGASVDVMAAGAAAAARTLHDAGRVDAVLAVGGSGGSSVAARVMQALPIGLPKLLVSTMAAGEVSPYVGEADVTLMYSVVDISGINSISRLVLGNAVAAAVGMAHRHERLRGEPEPADQRPLVGATMFGLTTPAVDEAREHLSDLGYEVLVFHATGAGGRAMEALVESGLLAGVLDLTTTELADDLVGGVLSAGPHRLEAAGRRGIPQVVSLGALDMVNFGPRDSVPAQFEDRRFLVHNPTVTLMRTTAEEMAALGASIAQKLGRASGPVDVFVPLRGLSGIDCASGPFEDTAADAALFTAVREGLAGTGARVHEVDAAINDPGFGRAAAQALHEQIAAANGDR